MGFKEAPLNVDGDHLCPSCNELHKNTDKPYYKGNMEYPIEVNNEEIHICRNCNEGYIIIKKS
tara:strand:- start:11674 stop:11862 length:189 start_codon:yes stop_codon:yes gene_type:complete